MKNKILVTLTVLFMILVLVGCDNSLVSKSKEISNKEISKTVNKIRLDVYLSLEGSKLSKETKVATEGSELSKEIKVGTFTTDENGSFSFVLSDKIILHDQPLFRLVINADPVAFPVETNIVYVKFDSTKGRTFSFVIVWLPPIMVKSIKGTFAVSGRNTAQADLWGSNLNYTFYR